jgi:hypothetical protein
MNCMSFKVYLFANLCDQFATKIDCLKLLKGCFSWLKYHLGNALVFDLGLVTIHSLTIKYCLSFFTLYFLNFLFILNKLSLFKFLFHLFVSRVFLLRF